MTTTEDRIAWLEQRLRQTAGEAVQANDRIEALEAALRKIDTHLDNFGYLPNMKARKIALAALAPEHDK